jgi:hypothetical protein
MQASRQGDVFDETRRQETGAQHGMDDCDSSHDGCEPVVCARYRPGKGFSVPIVCRPIGRPCCDA